MTISLFILFVHMFVNYLDFNKVPFLYPYLFSYLFFISLHKVLR